MKDGILIINKPQWYTSFDVVAKCRKVLGTKKIGHTGTLDPNASGILILCIGNALKMCELMDDSDKEYVAEVILGLSTDTLDTDSNATIIENIDVNLDKETIEKVVVSFKGTYMQEVPIYSAVKVNGRKLYEYARNNIPVTLPKKKVEIKDIDFIDMVQSNDNKIHFRIKATVGKGTYIRALVRDIGTKLGVPAVMNSLVRTRIGNFNLDDSYTLEEIAAGKYTLIDITKAFPNIRKITVDNEMAFRVRNGVIVDNLFDDEIAFIIDNNNTLLALYKNEENRCRPYKMFI